MYDAHELRFYQIVRRAPYELKFHTDSMEFGSI